jgi:S-adenosylmethionine-diacylglycerol 3-amino-3-carboxypropyl transferase
MNNLTYTSSYEDSHTDLEALKIKPTDVVLCITGSGARTLELLLGGGKKYISVDISSAQNFLLELLVAAFKSLSYEDILQFLGVTSSLDRVKIFQERLVDQLSPEAKIFWKKNKTLQKIRDGVIYSGDASHLLVLTSILKRFLGLDGIKDIFSYTEIQDQQKFWEEHHLKFEKKFKLFARFWKGIIRTAAFFRNPFSDNRLPSSSSRDIERVAQRFHDGIYRHLARSNPFMVLPILGKYDLSYALPLFLQNKSYPEIRQGLGKIEIVTESIDDYLKKCPDNSVDKFSFSNVPDALKKENILPLWDQLLRVCKPGGRIIMRYFRNNPLSPDFLPSIADKIKRLEEEEKRLELNDLSYVYNIVLVEAL